MNATDTRPGWDARTVQPLVRVGKPRPLHHQATCPLRDADTPVEVCPCTRRQRDYRATHPN